MRYLAILTLCIALAGTSGAAEEASPPRDVYYDINTTLMESTFRIHGPKKGGPPGSISFGTTFLMGKPTPDDPKTLYYVLVSAAHVFEEIDGETAVITLRDKEPNGNYTTKDWPIKIRTGSAPLFVKHPEVDASALYVNMPDDTQLRILPTALLADDAVFQKFEIHPGDELLSLGFPLYVSSDSGFPILRSGKIASYPITPTKIHKTLLFDFRVFSGNSGGPVYFADRGRVYGGSTHVGEVVQFVAGLVTTQLAAKLFNDQLIQLAGVVPSPFIIETINLLPPVSPYK